MHRFYVQKDDIRDNFVQIGVEDTAHMTRVLRLKEGDVVNVCDGRNVEYTGVIRSIGKQRALVELSDPRLMASEPGLRITLYQAMPKAGKLETIIQKCTEIGVSEFAPFYCERCVVKPGAATKTERMAKIALEASKQCGRGVIPKVNEPIGFQELLFTIKHHELVLLAWEEEKAAGIKNAVRGRDLRDVGVIIGPEGGISPYETELLRLSGAKRVTLGRRILRCETAGAVVAAVLLYEMDDMR